MTADPFVRERLSEAVDHEPVDVDSHLRMAMTHGPTVRSPRRWPIAAAALLATGAAVAFVAWTFFAHDAGPGHRRTPAPVTSAPGSPMPSPAPSPAPGTSKISLPDGASGYRPLAYGFGSLWVASSSGHSVTRVDAGTNDATTIPVESANSLAVGEGSVWVLGDSSVFRIDPGTDRVVATIDVGRGARSIAVGSGAVWVLDSKPGGSVMHRIDPSTGHEVASARVSDYSVEVAAGDEGVWLLVDVDAVVRFDPEANRVVGDLVPIGDRDDLAVGMGAVWVASQSSGELTKLDPSSGRILGTIPLCGENAASGGGCDVWLGDGRVWVMATPCCDRFPRLWSVDPMSDEVTRVPVPRVPITLWAVGGESLWFTTSGSYLFRTLVAPSTQTPGPPASPSSPAQAGVPSLAAVDFVDEQHGWVGGDGVVLGTSDGGATWSREYEGSANIDSIQFVDASHGWALGDHQLLVTSDGGARWTAASEPGDGLAQVQFVSAAVGWGISGGLGAQGSPVVHTLDGGRTWEAVSSAPLADWVCFGTASDGWVAAGKDAYRTSDGGATWTRAFTAPVRGSGWTSSIGCAGPAEAWLLTRGGAAMSQEAYALFRTADAGQSWAPVAAEAYFPAYPSIHLPVSNTIDCYAGPFEIVGPGRGAFVGVCDPMDVPTSVSSSFDGGRTWTHVRIPGIADYPWAAIGFADATHGWLAGSNDGRGVLFATDDGGRTWRRVDIRL